MISSIVLATLLAPAVRLPHEYDLIHVKFSISLDYKKETIRGQVVNQVVTKKANANIVFDKGPMKIGKVTLSPSLPADISSKGDTVQIKLKKAPIGKAVNISIEYSAEPEAGMYFVPQSRAFPALTDVAYTQGEMEDTRYWLPTYDYPDDKATTEGIISVPKGFSVLSNGALKSQKTNGETTTFHWLQSKPMSTYLISVVAGRYTKIPDGSFKNTPVEIWAPNGTEEMAKASFAGTDKIVKLYSELTGVDYPWAKYAQSFVPEFMFGGMENTSCTTQTINALFPENSKTLESADGLNAHELAHQWFGDLITCSNWSHIWVNEGWATFMPHFWVRQQEGEDAYHIARKGTYEGAKWGALQNQMVRSDYTIPMEMFDSNAYPGGAARMFMLMHELGEEMFWKCCNRYLQSNGYKNVTTESFFKDWSKTAGVDLDDFRKNWFYTKGVPKYKVSREGEKFTVTQSETAFNVPIEYTILDEELIRRKGRITSNSESFTLEKGQILILDPGAWQLNEIAYPSYTEDEWKIAYKHAENAAQKVRLLPALRSSQEFLKNIYRTESEAMKGQVRYYIKDDAFMFDLLRSGNDKERVTAMWQLSANAGKTGAELSQNLKEIINTSANEALVNSAFDCLMTFQGNEENAELGWNKATFDLRTKVSSLQWLSKGNPDKARQRALDAVMNFAPGPVRIAAIETLGVVKDKPNEREVFNLLVTLVKGRPYAPFSAAVSALESYGDSAAIPVLESRKNHNLHFARARIKGALDRMKQAAKR